MKPSGSLTGPFCNCCAIPCLTLLWEPHAWLPLLSLLLHPNLHINFIDLKCLFYTGWKLYLFWILLSAYDVMFRRFTARKACIFDVILVRIFPHEFRTEYDELNRTSECRKTQARITPNTDTFDAVVFMC